jgi:type IV pilus assembly protein PilM
VDLESYSMDFKILENVDTGEGSFTRVLLVAVPLKQIEEYMKLAALLKMETTAIDIPANCVSKLLFGSGQSAKPYFPELPGEFALVDFGAETTGIFIFSDGKLQFNRILLNGSSDIDRAISEQSSLDFKAAEQSKTSMVEITSEDTGESWPDEKHHFSTIARRSLDSLFEDMNRLFEFYISRGKGSRLQKLLITGGGSRLRGLEAYMSGYFGIPVEYFNSGSSIVYRGRKKKEDFLRDFPMLGSAAGALVRKP